MASHRTGTTGTAPTRSAVSAEDAVTVACVDAPPAADPAALLADVAGVDVVPVPDTDGVDEAPDAVDCVAAGTTAPDGGEALGLLADLRERDATLPFVLVAETLEDEPVEAVLDASWTEVVFADGSAPTRRLTHRIGSLVTHRQAARNARYAAAGLGAAGEGLDVVDRVGTVAFANSSFARQFDADPDSVRGQPWRSLFADGSTERIEAEALAAVDDGWEWLGTCEARRGDGSTVAVQVRVAGVDGHAFVLAVARPRSDESDGAAQPD